MSNWEVTYTDKTFPIVNPQEEKKEEVAMRFNNGKPQWGLVHYKSLEPMIKVLEFGAKKYSPDNWKKKMDRTKILESAQRHLAALMDGEEIDPETGESHIGNLMCNGMFYSYHFVINKKEDEPNKARVPD